MGALFDGIDDSITASALNIATGSVYILFKVDTVPGDTQYILAQDGAGFNQGDAAIYTGGGGGAVFFITSSGVANFTINSANLGVGYNNRYIHVVCLFGTGGMKMYVDGVEQADTDAATHGWNNTGTNLIMGISVSDTAPMGGTVLEAAFWNTRLSGDEISQLYDSRLKQMSLQIQPANLVQYLPMDDGANGTSADGQTFRDLSGNGNDGIGNDGANNTGLTNKAEEVLTYPTRIVYPIEQGVGIIPLLQWANLGNDLYNGTLLGCN